MVAVANASLPALRLVAVAGAIALGGIPNKTQVGDVGIDGRIFPVAAAPTKAATAKGQTPAFGEFLDHWYPIQVKQKDKVGRPDIDASRPS